MKVDAVHFYIVHQIVYYKNPAGKTCCDLGQ